jgi:hypothetical protein
MTRLGPNGEDKTGPKTVMQLGPSVDEVRAGAAGEDLPVEEQKPITTAASYSKRIKARQQATASLKGRGKPLGGAPPIEPEKAAAIAATMAPRPSFGQEEQARDVDPQEFRVPQEPPQSLGGVGSAFDVNQKIARGEVDRPVSLREAKNMSKAKQQPAKLSQESVDGLEQAQAQIQEEEQAQVQPPDLVDPTEAELAAAEEEMLHRETPFDYENIVKQQTMLVSQERKEAIESRLSELDIADMITKREIVQDIPIIAGKLIYTLRTFNQHEHLFCLQYVYENPGSVTYAEEFLNTCKLVCALVAVNGARLPDHRKGVGTIAEEIDKDLFQKKMFHVASFPIQIIADLSIQAIWFNQRVNQLLGVENLKNG